MALKPDLLQDIGLQLFKVLLGLDLFGMKVVRENSADAPFHSLFIVFVGVSIVLEKDGVHYFR